MRRRQNAEVTPVLRPVPESLLHPVRADWPGGELEVDRARRAFVRDNPGSVPIDVSRAWEVQEVRWAR